MKIYSDLSEVFINGFWGTEAIVAAKYGEEIGRKFWNRHMELQPEFRDLLRGRTSEREFWRKFFEQKNFCQGFTIDEAMSAFGENMKQVVPGTLQVYQRIISFPNAIGENRGRTPGMPEIYILSDHIVERLPDIQATHPGVFSVVSRYFWSCFMGKIKQDPGFFEDVLDMTGDRTDEVVFIDDDPRNVAAAEQSGLIGIVFKNADQLETDLTKLDFEFAPKIP